MYISSSKFWCYVARSHLIGICKTYGWSFRRDSLFERGLEAWCCLKQLPEHDVWLLFRQILPDIVFVLLDLPWSFGWAFNHFGIYRWFSIGIVKGGFPLLLSRLVPIKYCLLRYFYDWYGLRLPLRIRHACPFSWFGLCWVDIYYIFI